MARILMIGNFSLEHKGTMRARALPLAQALARRGHEPTLAMAALDAPGSAGVTTVDGGVGVINVVGRGPAIWSELGTAAFLLRLALAAHVDVVHAFKPIAYAGVVGSVVAAIPRRGHGQPRLVFDADDWEGTGGWVELDRRPAWQRWLVDAQERWNLGHCAALTVASRHLTTLAWAMGARREAVHYLPNGVSNVACPVDDAARHRARLALHLEDGPVVLLYTRFAEFPLDFVTDITARVSAHRPDATLLIVGRGLHGEEQELARQLARPSLERFVRFAGWVNVDDLPTYFAAADLAIYPLADTLINRTKCPAKLVELMASGLPVVAEAVGQATEYLVNGQSGVLVNPGDRERFAAETLNLIGSKQRRQQLGEGAAAQIRRHFLWDHLAETAELAYGLRERTDTRDGSSDV